MENTSMCKFCRERFKVATIRTQNTISRCPGCNQINTSIPSTSTLASTLIRSSLLSQTPACTIDRFCSHKLKKKLSATAVSLNCNPSPLLSRSHTRQDQPRKRALLIGVSYKKFKYKLKGTINDVCNMRDFLINDLSFRHNNVLVLTEKEADSSLIPTKKNIEMALKWLVEGTKSGDSLVFYFSGHGLRQPDWKEDENDGFDETICPTDFMEEGTILDRDIHSIIASPLEQGANLHSIVDACQSGNILDLPYIYNSHLKKWEDRSPHYGIWKNTRGGWVTAISACEDDQEFADTTASTRNTKNGVLTYLLVDLFKKCPGLTYGEVLDTIHEDFQRVNNEGGCLATSKIFRRIFQNSSQRPQLSSSRMFDVYNTPFTFGDCKI
ncbi:metacaspase-1-like [Carica papaya]|uniref:metacaspase-1-like n=1 Tax=Carica papaya TaxID=3649 RepID=UPI000B8CEC9E|nr:metacaspase-1-like [Carica papaya]